MTESSAANEDAGATPPPLSAQVRDRVREGIIRGVYPQGTRLPEARLAAELDVSRNPLRAAIPLLQADGFVATNPRRGAVVFQWTRDAVEQLFDARLAVEVAAAEYAARRVQNGADLAPLVAAIRTSHDVVAHHDPYQIAETSTMVHVSIVELAGNDLLSTLMRSIAGRLQWLFYLTSARDALLARDEHDRISAAIQDGNEGLARALAYAHIESGRTASVELISAGTPLRPADAPPRSSSGG